MPSALEWDKRFLRGDHTQKAPDPLLCRSREYWDRLRPGDASRPAALDVACGAGRHAVWLAEAGCEVTGIDFSPQGLEKARQLAETRGVAVNWVERDLESGAVDLGEQLYDLVAVFFYLHRPLLPLFDHCLRPGGLLVYKTFLAEPAEFRGRRRNPAYTLAHNELVDVFTGFRVLVYEEDCSEVSTASLIAQKP